MEVEHCGFVREMELKYDSQIDGEFFLAEVVSKCSKKI